MSLAWWDIPGPSRFIRRVENDLLDRVNVVAALPLRLGRDWFDFFRRRLSDGEERVDVVRLEPGCSPLDLLCSTFTTSPAGVLTIGKLVTDPGFRGRVVGVLLEPTEPVKEWMEFVVQYERECRLIDTLNRTVLLVVTSGVSPRELPGPEMLLRVHCYEGYARPQDCYMYAWALLGVGETQSWRTELKMALCAQLAQWDPHMCEALSDWDIESIIRRESYVNADGCAHDQHRSFDPDEGWAKGILERRDGEVVYHTAWLASARSSKEFERRVWTAQVQVVFPLIEQVRHQTIDMYGRLIPMPMSFGDDEYHDVYDLEIGMLRRAIGRVPGVPPAVLRRLDQAWEFRNALAHVELLTDRQLRAFEP